MSNSGQKITITGRIFRPFKTKPWYYPRFVWSVMKKMQLSVAGEHIDLGVLSSNK